jgi:hypothetical protein
LQFLFPKATRGLEPISYRGVLVSTLLHATVYVFLHNLLNVLLHTANKMAFKKNLDFKNVTAVSMSYDTRTERKAYNTAY